MKNKINVAELLKDCPKGMELDSPIFENLEFDHIDEDNPVYYPIICRVKCSYGGYNIHAFTEYGCYNTYEYSKCAIFPKSKTTWEGFVPPCKFKDGDILTNARGGIFIYKGLMYYNKQLADFYCGYRIGDETFVLKVFKDRYFGDVSKCRLATEEEKQKLFDAIKENGYKWNSEDKTLKKLINKNKFVVGATITNGKTISKIVSRDVDSYKLEDGNYVFFNEVHNWELVPNKFDITTLEPFDKVLVRLTNNCVWMPKFFYYYDLKTQCYPFVTTDNMGYPQCIPYSGNEHLCRKTNNCDEFYRNWE